MRAMENRGREVAERAFMPRGRCCTAGSKKNRPQRAAGSHRCASGLRDYNQSAQTVRNQRHQRNRRGRDAGREQVPDFIPLHAAGDGEDHVQRLLGRHLRALGCRRRLDRLGEEQQAGFVQTTTNPAATRVPNKIVRIRSLSCVPFLPRRLNPVRRVSRRTIIPDSTMTGGKIGGKRGANVHPLFRGDPRSTDPSWVSD